LCQSLHFRNPWLIEQLIGKHLGLILSEAKMPLLARPERRY
jgi:hypothetical protein